MSDFDLCDCGGSGILLEQTYGTTTPTHAGAVIIQRCDACETYPGDLDAAKAFASLIGGTVWAVGSFPTMTRESDCWVSATPDPYPACSVSTIDGVNWIPERDALRLGIMPERDDA